MSETPHDLFDTINRLNEELLAVVKSSLHREESFGAIVSYLGTLSAQNPALLSPVMLDVILYALSDPSLQLHQYKAICTRIIHSADRIARGHWQGSDEYRTALDMWKRSYEAWNRAVGLRGGRN